MIGIPAQRADALERAKAHSVFLAGLAARFPDTVDLFLREGAAAAITRAVEPGGVDLAVDLRRRRHRLALAAALGDLSGELDLEAVTGALSDFADSAIDAAIRGAFAERLPDAEPAGLVALALGKLGSRELNYSSDVDLIFLFDPAILPRRPREEAGEAAVRLVRRTVELLQARDSEGFVERVDLRLRPASEATPIALSVGAALSHYESQAETWERAAFIRARACAGDKALGERFLAELQPFVWRRALDYGAIEQIGGLSNRIRDHYAQGQAFGPGFDLKRGRGGIREAEFFAQVLQLIHGGREPALRVPATVGALEALAASGHLPHDEAGAVAAAYRALRTAEHRVQMLDDRQEHRLPAGDTLERLARLDGAADSATWLAGLRPHVDAVGRLFDRLVAPKEDRLSNDPDLLRAELEELGMTPPDEALRRIADWRSGRVRALRSTAARQAFEAMLPTLFRAIAEGPDWPRALNRFSDLVERLSSGVNLFRLLEARPQMAEMVALVLAHAPPLADQLSRRPALLDGLIDETSFALPPPVDELAARFAGIIGPLPMDEALDRMRRLVGERRFALGVQLLAAHRDPIAVAEGYSDLAEATIVALAERVEEEFAVNHGRVPGGDMVTLALGRLGGRALTHASDLDLIYLYDAPDGVQSDGRKPLSATDYYNRLASRLTAALSVPTAAGPLYDVDTRLRPQGTQGMLAVSFDGFDRYQREQAWTWEHMALCRARPLTGSAHGRARAEALLKGVLGMARDPAKVRADAATMRADIARHKPPAGPLDVKLGPGGLVDLEFAVHTLQLSTRIGLDPRLEVAIADLAGAGLVDGQADADLRLLSRLLVVMRLVAPVEQMDPAPATRAKVADLCGHADWDGLLEAIDAARQRVAALWDKVKDGA